MSLLLRVKADLVSQDALDGIKQRVHQINPVPAFVTQHAQVAIEQILGIKAYQPKGLSQAVLQQHGDHDHEEDGKEPHVHHWHDESLVHLTLYADQRVNIGALKDWLAALLWKDLYTERPEEAAREQQEEDDEEEEEVYRMKGAMLSEDGTVFYLQSVQRLFDLFPAAGPEPEQQSVQGSKLVILGRRLNEQRIRDSFHRILVSNTST